MIDSFARHVLGTAAALCMGLVASSAQAQAQAQAIDDDGTCPELAQKMSKIYFGFPEIVDGSIERFASWKASCAAKAPAGQGNVVAFCQGKLQGEGNVFFWIKAAVEAESSGYEICD
ncbi:MULTISPECIES: hypothetical protein [Brucella]|jgi:hypothetical protein|uniref:hypothetical protein n=1 Tax=Brucella TaxID=234 RepID=UPI0028A195D2|nr:hypothetical protein [Brucella sp.]